LCEGALAGVVGLGGGFGFGWHGCGCCGGSGYVGC
jgi:hypothetical protein